MAYVKSVRIWKNVPEAAKTKRLSSRLTKTIVDIDWDQFDELEHFAIRLLHTGSFTPTGSHRLLHYGLV